MTQLTLNTEVKTIAKTEVVNRPTSKNPIIDQMLADVHKQSNEIAKKIEALSLKLSSQN